MRRRTARPALMHVLKRTGFEDWLRMRCSEFSSSPATKQWLTLHDTHMNLREVSIMQPRRRNFGAREIGRVNVWTTS